MRGIEVTLSRNETTEGFCMYLNKNIYINDAIPTLTYDMVHHYVSN